MKYLLILFTLGFSLLSSVPVHSQNIRILDKETLEPIINAHIVLADGEIVTVSGKDGEINLSLITTSTFSVRALGFRTTEFVVKDIKEIIYLPPLVLEMTTELIVEAANDRETNIHSYHQHNSAQSLDELLSNVDGMDVIQRGAYAWEPMVRGQADQRMNLTIDGVPVFKACVDKMDPITSYVEINNLSKLEVDKSGTRVAAKGNGNASVNLITQKAQWERLKLDFETSLHTPSSQQIYRMNVSGGDTLNKNAFRVSGAYRKADDMIAGNSIQIENTQFEKVNLNLHYRHKFSSKYEFEANYITDKAYDIGYPGLLMDANKALADIGRIQLNIADFDSQVFKINSVVAYANMIRHSMDDYERDVANRDVMRGMYMPMYGETKTFGGKLNGSLTFHSTQTDWYFDAFSSEAFGDMKMQSLDPTIEEMLIYNMDDIITRQVSLGFEQAFQLSNDLNLRLEESVQFKHLETRSESFASMFEGIYNRNYEPSQHLLFSASGTLFWMATDALSLTNSLVYSERSGNHMETHGHYIYNYTDGYFYDGNPWLKKERSINYEVHAMWKLHNQSFSLTGFTKYYTNYIDGIISEEISNVDFKFKKYANVGNALLMGSELRILNRLGKHFLIENRLSYLFAQNLSLNESLPMIPPLNGVSTIGFNQKNTSVSFDITWASQQNGIAQSTSIEDKTDGFAVFGLNVEQQWFNNRFSTSLKLNNLTDKYYNRHTSIGNNPEQGFNVVLTLNYRLGN
ncbi:MAG: TonB-dependent receptor [Balneolaceae bacterium]